MRCRSTLEKLVENHEHRDQIHALRRNVRRARRTIVVLCVAFGVFALVTLLPEIADYLGGALIVALALVTTLVFIFGLVRALERTENGTRLRRETEDH